MECSVDANGVPWRYRTSWTSEMECMVRSDTCEVVESRLECVVDGGLGDKVMGSLLSCCSLFSITTTETGSSEKDVMV